MTFLEFGDTRDFPYYNHNPQLSKFAWLILILMLPISFLLQGVFSIFSEFIGSIVFCLSLLIPLLYFSNWDYSLMFHKPTRNEIILAILMFCGYMIYADIFGTIYDFFINSPTTQAAYNQITIESMVSLIFSMMGEELIKFIPLMFFMRFIYKHSSNKKLAIRISTIIVLIGFGLLHYNPPELDLIPVLFLQGLGSIFEVYGYIKTKNIFVPYISHILTDASIYIIMFFFL